MKTTLLCSAACLFALATPALADDEDIAKIIDEGLTQSEIMPMAHELMDRIGPRLANSPGARRSEAWAITKMQGLGLENVHREGFEFGRGWEMVDIEVDMLSPRPLELTAIASAWTPGTDGPVEAEIFVAPMRGEEDFDAYRGKLAGKIVMISMPGTGDEPTRPTFRRYSGSDISDMDVYSQPDYDPHATERRVQRPNNARLIDNFLADEGAIAVVTRSYRDGKLLHGSAYRYRVGDTPRLPQVEMAAEDYRRLARLAKMGDAPRLRIDSRVRWHDDDTQAYNIIGDIKGSDAGAGYVMAGAHFDSWAAGDGAVDNGAGSVVVLEAARILKTMPRPKRTIRFALWGAEEQGLHGSKAYINRHLARRPIPADATPDTERAYWGDAWPIEKLDGYDDMKAYFNMDNGSGRFRGIYAEHNTAATGLLGKWLGAFRELDAHRVVIRESGGTDHVYMQDIGLPAFQFIQDPLDYGARLHHTNIDTLDHMRPDDLRQAATVMAGMLWQAANSDDTLPAEPLPQQPTATDPFEYRYPSDD